MTPIRQLGGSRTGNMANTETEAKAEASPGAKSEACPGASLGLRLLIRFFKAKDPTGEPGYYYPGYYYPGTPTRTTPWVHPSVPPYR